MAIVAGTATVYTQVGNREDLEDLIYNISPTETPFLSMFSQRGKMKAVFHEWQTDSLASAAANAVAEGDDATYVTPAATTRLGNRAQISRKTVSVSGTQEVVDKAGRDSQYEYELAKRSAELKRDMEVVITRNQGSSAGAQNIPRVLGSLEAMYTTNVARRGGGTSGGFSGGDWSPATDSSAGSLLTITEAMLKTAMQQAWTQGGHPDKVMVGPINKSRISAFAGIATLYRDTAGSKKQASILGAADVYVSDFGEVKIVASRFSREATAHVLDTEYWSVNYLRPFTESKLAKTGDSEKGMILAEYTLVGKNQAASAVIADLAA